jgi:hypothetical protein
MKDRHRFQPALAGLESRLVLSRLATISPVSPAKLAIAAHKNAAQAVVDQVNQAFDSFTTDYLQAQGAYFEAPNVGARNAFKNFVTQRTDLLAAQLTRIFAHVPGSLNKLETASSGGPVVVQQFLRTRINGNARTSLVRSLEGGSGNPSAIPPALKQPTVTTNTGQAIAPTYTGQAVATIYTDQAISAIETARTASLNSLGFLYGKSFDKHR